jgi:hypothetical protein
MNNTNGADKELDTVPIKEKKKAFGMFFFDILRAFEACFACHACPTPEMSAIIMYGYCFGKFNIRYDVECRKLISYK